MSASALSALVIGLTLLLSGCKGGPTAGAEEPKSQASTPPPRAVQVTPAAERTVARTVSATGTLAADEQVVLGTKVAGRLAESGTDERIDPEKPAIVRQARALLADARLTRDRSVKLMELDLIARAQLDSVEANLQVAEGRYQDAQEEVRNRQAIIAQRRSELDLSRQQLADTVIVSPLDGAVSLKQASVGEYLTAGAPISTLVRMHPLRLRVPVPEREGTAVRAGHAVTLTVEGDSTVYRGRVVRLSPIVQEQNRTLMVEAEVPNERGFLRPGSFARVEIMTEVSQPVVTVPASAVIVFAGVEKVLVVRQGKTAEVRVTTGRRLGEDVEIVEGLKGSDPVVTRPGNLVGGQAVTVV